MSATGSAPGNIAIPTPNTYRPDVLKHDGTLDGAASSTTRSPIAEVTA